MVYEMCNINKLALSSKMSKIINKRKSRKKHLRRRCPNVWLVLDDFKRGLWSNKALLPSHFQITQSGVTEFI